MAKRHRDAVAIQGGACNPIAILNSIENAILELKKEIEKEISKAQNIPVIQCFHLPTDTVTGDPAIRLMVHQLAHICKTDSIGDWSECMDYCEARQ